MHWQTIFLRLKVMDYLRGARRDDGVPTFEGPEFQPNVISMKAVGGKGSGVDVFENGKAQVQDGMS